MNQNSIFRHKLGKNLFAFSCILFFALAFSFVINKDWKLIFEKDLYIYDESANSVVMANLTRKFFPTMIRINPLVDEQTGWMEGPYWQHIPPLFAYVPLPFFKMDGQVTIEVKRLSYAFVLLFGGIIFIFSVYRFEKSITSLIAATLAAILWILTPFSRRLITGLSFGSSDIVLAFMLICSFSALCWYLFSPTSVRKNYSLWKLIIISLIVVLPILTKNILGAIPVVTFFIIYLYDQKQLNSKFLLSLFSSIGVISIYFGSLYLSSPITFRREIFVSFSHMQNFEGWARPWYFFLTFYLPEYYLGRWTLVFFLGIFFGLYQLVKKKIFGHTKIILVLSIGWFFWNLLVVSFIKSKAPAFIFQTYLLGLFFIIYALLIFIENNLPIVTNIKVFITNMSAEKKVFLKKIFLTTTVLIFLITLIVYVNLFYKFRTTRSELYKYSSEHEHYYHFAEVEEKKGINTGDLFVLNSSQNDCWFRYYILFLTGAEARTFDELLAAKTQVTNLQNKYQKLYFIIDNSENLPNISIPHTVENVNNFKVLNFDTKFLDKNYLDTLKFWLTVSLNRQVYSSNLGCSWL